MACVIEGISGQRWIAPEWIARNAARFLIPRLDNETRPSGPELAARLRTIITERAPRVPLGDLLALPNVGRAWLEAVASAQEAIDAEDPMSWNDPSSYEPFRQIFSGLRLLPLTPNQK
jgi:hypothetical protein